MNTGFDLDHIGRREPYRVPADFFQHLEDKIINKTIAPRKRRWVPRRAVLTVAASVAAIVAVMAIIRLHPMRQTYAMEDVERVFAQLSEADQEYLLDTYQEDIFINQQPDQ